MLVNFIEREIIVEWKILKIFIIPSPRSIQAKFSRIRQRRVKASIFQINEI